MRWLALLLVLVVSPFMASDADFTWDQPAGAQVDSWNVYIGTTSGTHSLVANPAVMTYSFPDGFMTPNVRNYVVLTAVGPTGESAKSIEVDGFPRPLISAAVPVQDVGFIRLTITGWNFSDGIAAVDVVFAGMTVIGVTRVNSMQLLVDYTVDPGTPPVGADLTVSNTWQRGPAGGDAGLVTSLTSDVFLVPTLVPLPPVIMDVN